MPKITSNYLITIIKFIFFLLILCFVISFSKSFIGEVNLEEDINFNLLYISSLSYFLVCTLLVDLNNLYNKIQKFFFHSSFLSFIVPSILIVMGIGFFLIPKIFNLNFSRNLFLFLGGFILTSHMIFIVKNFKGTNFTTFINYLFIFSILYIVNLFIFVVYLNVAFKIDLIKIIIDGGRNGVILIKDIFSQFVR